MRRTLLIAAFGLLVAGTFWYARAGRTPVWTTDSPEALAELERGRQAAMRLYAKDAREAFERALQLDPDFVAARLFLLDNGGDDERRAQLVEELRQVDPSRLNERERFLLEVALATAAQNESARRRVIDQRLVERPDDPFALVIAAHDAWARLDWPAAEQGYRRLLEADPNWVMAHNILGYIAMAQGRFADAEARFRTYKFVAPDQANPHDSLGELLVLLGRYDEATTELEEALAIRPDFCAPYGNLLNIALLDRRPENLPSIAERASRNCPPGVAAELRCATAVAAGFLTGDAELPWREAGTECESQLKAPRILTHRLALVSGRRDLALAIEQEIADRLAQVERERPRHVAQVRIIGSFLAAQRLAIEGDWTGAIAEWREVEADGAFWQTDGLGVLKLLARRELAHALRSVGDAAGADAAIEAVRAVNPPFADEPWEGWPLAGVPVASLASAAH